MLTSTKWNRLLVPHAFSRKHLEIKLRCIGVDPYYLTYKAEELGYHPEVILSGRRINDGMGVHVGDIRNTKVVDIVSELAISSRKCLGSPAG